MRAAGQHGQAARCRCFVGSSERGCPDARRIRFCRRIRRRTQIPRDAPVSGRAHLFQPHPRLHRRACAWPAAILLMQPLAGVTVISLEQAVAAPLATRHLADLGARVIKIERPEVGDFARQYDSTVRGLSSHFVWCNRSKESLTLDLKQPEAKEILNCLMAKADVFVQNFAPGACERLGLGTEALHTRYPRLIVCNFSGYGSTGPY